MSMTDEKGRTISYAYNDDYELTRVDNPNGQTEEYAYDPAGNRTSMEEDQQGETQTVPIWL